MPEEKQNGSENAAEESVAIDREVLDVLPSEKRRGSGRGPIDSDAERKKKKLANDGLRAIRAKNARVFTELRTGLEGFLFGLAPAFDSHFVDFLDSSFLFLPPKTAATRHT